MCASACMFISVGICCQVRLLELHYVQWIFVHSSLDCDRIHKRSRCHSQVVEEGTEQREGEERADYGQHGGDCTTLRRQ